MLVKAKEDSLEFLNNHINDNKYNYIANIVKSLDNLD